MLHFIRRALAVAGLAASAACNSSDATAVTAGEAMVASVTPAPGAVATSLAGPITVTFRHAMGRDDVGPMGTGPLAHSMDMVLSVHEGSVATPAIAGTTTWSSDRTVLTFTPSAPLKPSTGYVLFLGARMTTADGRQVTPDECMTAAGMTGTGSMGAGMMSGNMGNQRGAAVHHEMSGTQPTGMGMAGTGGMMGGVTRADGVHGMTFSFTSGR